MAVPDSTSLAHTIRAHALRMVAAARGSHLGGALSIADVVAVLYADILRILPSNPAWPDRDRFVLSKGHCCSVLYAALAEIGFFSVSELETYGQDGSRLMAHISHKVPGVEFSTGSLGHGLPFALGKALAAKRSGRAFRAFALLSDGELDEGSNWEAILLAPQLQLDNLVLIIDYNKIQSLGAVSDVIELEPLRAKLEAFRWAVREVDGHNHADLHAALSSLPFSKGQPSCLITHTTKGKGVDYMENQIAWHYRSPDADLLAKALAQLEQNPS
jgi:transketolase